MSRQAKAPAFEAVYILEPLLVLDVSKSVDVQLGPVDMDGDNLDEALVKCIRRFVFHRNVRE